MKRLEPLFSDTVAATAFWIGVDVLFINLASILAYWLRYDIQLFRAVDPAFTVPYVVYLPFVALFTTLLIVVYRQQGIYRMKRQVSWVDEFYAILHGTATGSVITIVVIFLYRASFYSRLIFIYAGIFTVIFLGLVRFAKVGLLRHLRRRGIGAKRVLIVGAGEVARTVMRVVVANPECGLNIIGFVDDHPAKGETDIGRFRALGKTANLVDLLPAERIDEVIITLPWQYHRKIMQIMALCERKHISSRIVPDMFQMRLSHMHVEEIAGVPMIGVKDSGISGLNQFIKRAIDVTIASLLLGITAPLAGLFALMIKMESPGPIFFQQQRVGKNGRIFTIYKFRSMVDGADAKKAEASNSK